MQDLGQVLELTKEVEFGRILEGLKSLAMVGQVEGRAKMQDLGQVLELSSEVGFGRILEGLKCLAMVEQVGHNLG